MWRFSLDLNFPAYDKRSTFVIENRNLVAMKPCELSKLNLKHVFYGLLKTFIPGTVNMLKACLRTSFRNINPTLNVTYVSAPSLERTL